MKGFSDYDYLCDEPYFYEGIGHVKCPTLRDIRRITYGQFNIFLSYISITQKQFLETFGLAEKFNSLSDEEKEKNIGADNHRSDDTGSIFYYLSSLVFHCIYRNKINCRTNYTACKSAVEFLCTDTCCIAGLYHCIWTIFLWFCLCIWNMG